jgi:hypothetical protein
MSDYPTTPVFTTVNLQSQSPTLISEAVSGKIQARQIAGQRWSFSASYAPMTRSEFAPVSAFIMQQRGRLNTFTIELPIMSDSASSATGTLAANGAATSGDTVITVDGMTGTLQLGDLIKFDGHDKVYMVVAKSGTNMTSMTIEPPLVEDVADDEEIVYNDVPMKVRLNNDVQEFGLRTDSLVSYEVDFIEAI